MAERLVRVCDACGEAASGDPIKFGWGTAHYETDLCDEHRAALTGLVEMAIKNARRLGGRAPAMPVPASRPRVVPSEVRAWAKRKRIKVNESGRLPESVVEQYLADVLSSA